MTNVPTIRRHPAGAPNYADFQTDSEYYMAVQEYLLYIDNWFAPDTEPFAAALNAIGEEIEEARDHAIEAAYNAGLSKNAAEAAATLAQNTVATLPMGSIKDTTQSSMQSYSSNKVEARLAQERAEIEAQIVPSFGVGDFLRSAGARSIPTWLACNGDSYNTAAYADLYNLLGDMPSSTPIAYTAPAADNGLLSGQSQDSAYYAVDHSAAPYLKVFKWNGTGFSACTLSAAPTTYAGNGIGSIAFSPQDGAYLILCGEGGGSMNRFYKRTADLEYTALTFPASIYGNKGVWSSDAQYFAWSTSVAPYLHVFRRDGDSLTPLTVPTGATEGTWQVAMHGNIIYTVGQTKIFEFVLNGDDVEYVGDYAHGMGHTTTSQRRSNASITSDGRFLFLASDQDTNLALGWKMGGIFDTTNKTMQYLKAHPGEYDYGYYQTSATTLSSYKQFVALDNGKMIGTLGNTANSYGRTVVFGTKGGSPMEIMRLSSADTTYLYEGQILSAGNTHIIRRHKGTTTGYRIPLGAYLPFVHDTYINTGVQA